MRVIEYETNVEEVNKTLELVDEDKKIVIESKDKIIIVCELSKEQDKKLKENLRIFTANSTED